jgi:hypothetical protein
LKSSKSGLMRSVVRHLDEGAQVTQILGDAIKNPDDRH